jgi:hypothetical protein
MAYVFCVSGGSVQLGPVPIQLVPGRAYAADDPVVRQYPQFFADTPTVYNSYGDIVEQATANPGNRRSVKRGG